MSSAGTVTVDFSAETAKFTAELKKVRGDLSALKRDSAAVNKTLASFGSAIKGVVGFAAAAVAIRAVVRATAEAERAQALLNNALSAAGANVKAASADFQAYASQLQRTTTFGDEAIVQVETLLLSFQGLSGDTVKRATAAVLDLSTRMGIDAPAAAKLLGKALADPERGMAALSKAGVAFSDSQKETIKALKESGDLAGAQGVVLGELERRFQGAAAAARNTFGGAIAGLNNAFGDLLEGKGGVNAATDSINALSDVLANPQTQHAFSTIISGLVKVIDFAAKAAAGLALVFTGKGGNKSVDIDLKIERLESRLLGIAPKGRGGPDGDRMRSEIESQIAHLKIEQREILGLGQLPSPLGSAKVGGPNSGRKFKPSAKSGAAFVTGGTPSDDVESETAAEFEKRQKAATDLATAEYEGLVAVEELITELHRREVDKRAAVDIAAGLSLERLSDETHAQYLSDALERLAIDEAAAKKRVEIEAQAQLQMQQFVAAGFNAAQALMGSHNKKIRAIAKVAFAFEKAQALAATIILTKQSVMATYARLGYPWGIPAAAAVGALGALQVAAIVSTFPGGGSSSSGGYGGGGAAGLTTPNNPIYNRGSDGEQNGASQKSSIQVIVNQTGWISKDMVGQLMDTIREEADGRDVILFSNNSRQAQELRET